MKGGHKVLRAGHESYKRFTILLTPAHLLLNRFVHDLQEECYEPSFNSKRSEGQNRRFLPNDEPCEDDPGFENVVRAYEDCA